MWYTLIGLLIVLVVATIVSFLTGAQDPRQLDPKLIYDVSSSSSLGRILSEKWRQYFRCPCNRQIHVSQPSTLPPLGPPYLSHQYLLHFFYSFLSCHLYARPFRIISGENGAQAARRNGPDDGIAWKLENYDPIRETDFSFCFLSLSLFLLLPIFSI